MTSTLLMLTLLSQVGQADPTLTEAVSPPLPASSAAGWLYLMLLYPKPDGALHPGAFASLGLGVDNAR